VVCGPAKSIPGTDDTLLNPILLAEILSESTEADDRGRKAEHYRQIPSLREYFPPDKTAVVGAYSGNVQVTMEISTDLVNWTSATNGLVYTNSPAARFFRIKLVTKA